MRYGDYRDPLPGETSNAYWLRMTEYEKAHGIDPCKGSTPWPSPQRKPRIFMRFASWLRLYFKGEGGARS